MRLRRLTTDTDQPAQAASPPRILMHTDERTTNGRSTFHAVSGRRHHDDELGWYWECDHCQRVVGYSPADLATHVCPVAVERPERLPLHVTVLVFGGSILLGTVVGILGAYACVLLGWIG